MDVKACISCGMPMEEAEEFAAGDTAKDFCCYCAREDGSLQSYQERLDKQAGWFVETQGLDAAAARQQARTVMAGMPAWKGRG